MTGSNPGLRRLRPSAHGLQLLCPAEAGRHFSRKTPAARIRGRHGAGALKNAAVRSHRRKGAHAEDSTAPVEERPFRSIGMAGPQKSAARPGRGRTAHYAETLFPLRTQGEHAPEVYII